MRSTFQGQRDTCHRRGGERAVTRFPEEEAEAEEAATEASAEAAAAAAAATAAQAAAKDLTLAGGKGRFETP